MSVVEEDRPRSAGPAPVAETIKVANRLTSTKIAGGMVKEYWDRLFTARERGAAVVWYNGAALNPFFQAAGIEWCHGEAFGARLAAMHLEGPAQLAGEEYGYVGELCSYARTHLGCAVLTQRSTEEELSDSGVVGLVDQETLASRLPTPDFYINAYAGCSTGQQWDEIAYRIFDKQIPMFKVSYPMLWANKPDSGYLRGQEWDEASAYIKDQLYRMVEFIEVQTGRKFDWDALRESMHYIKRAAEIRLEAMALCRAAPTPATYWDWIASIAPINFLPGNQALVDYFTAMKTEIEQRLTDGVSALPNEKYRLTFDGIMNWNKLGWLAEKFAAHGAAVMNGRYTHNVFWQEPQLIDEDDPMMGIAQHYLTCPANHVVKIQAELMLRDAKYYGIDGVVFHASRTCRAWSNGQNVMSQIVQRELGVPTMFFEGDIADAAFYKDDLLDSRLEAMLEAIDVQRMKG
jgi:benzoyl-CoA reductase subunit B